MNIEIAEVDRQSAREKYFARMKAKMVRIKDRFSYMDNAKSREVQHQRRMIECGGHRFKTVTEFERYCVNEGINPDSIDANPQVIPQGGGLADIIFRVRIKR